MNMFRTITVRNIILLIIIQNIDYFLLGNFVYNF